MSEQNRNKLNHLEAILPEGLLVDAAWLASRGYYASLRNRYVASGWLQQPARGVFRRPRGQISWEQAVISLQTLLAYSVTVGGRTALELQGYAHYLPQSQQNIHLYSDKKLPIWVFKLPFGGRFISHSYKHLWKTSIASTIPHALNSETTEGAVLEGDFRVTHWGYWKWPLMISTPERAYLELLDELPEKETFHMADVMMEGLINISPNRMQNLLEEIKNIKVKRLFFFFADRHRHAWLSHIDRKKIDCGEGKRMLVKGGKFDPVYQITVPKEFFVGKENGL